MISKPTNRAAPARIRRRLKPQILVSESKAPISRPRSRAACSAAGGGAAEIGASADIRASDGGVRRLGFPDRHRNASPAPGQRPTQTQEPLYGSNS